MSQDSTGVRIRSKNVGSNYSVPKPFNTTNIGFNSVANYSFARNIKVKNSMTNSSRITSKSFRDVRYVNENLTNVKRSITLNRTNNKAYNRLLSSPYSTNRKTSTVFSEKFFGYLKRDFSSTITQNSTYQDRLNKSYEELGENATRRKLR